ncbi:MAG: chromate efflux transporter [Saprospiraceae bacterium]|nr:chromate efflux transporter [Saprospiraceae bacterium]
MEKNHLKEIFQYFFRLGFIAFGGPAAHVALMEEDLVKRKKWLTTEEFLDYMGATNLIPGPNSTEMTMHCGYHRGGPAGLFVAGASFIFPAVLLTLIVAIFFEKFSDIAWVVPIIDSIKAAVLSFIAAAILKLGRKAVKNYFLAIVGVLVLVASFLGVNEILCILLAGVLAMIIKFASSPKQFNSVIPLFFLMAVPYSHLKLFLIFLKVGAVLFGSGYVLFAYLDGELIQNLEWLTHSDLVEAIAIGQVTPGPVLSTSTFIGYKLGGVSGALWATLGIFLPSFLYVWLLNPLIPKMRQNKLLSSFHGAVNVAAVAVMLVVTFQMAQSILIDWKTILVCGLSFFVYFYFKGINTLWIILGGAAMGFAMSYI